MYRLHILCMVADNNGDGCIMQMDYERWTQIDRHNHELLARMEKIMMSRGRVDHLNDYKAKPWLVCGVCISACQCIVYVLACS